MLDSKECKSFSLPLLSDVILDLNRYISCKDFYCYVYLGGCSEYIFILNSLKSYFLSAFPNMNIKICCKQSILNKILEYDDKFIMPIESTDLKSFGAFEEIKYNLLTNTHPLENIIELLNVKILFKCKQNKNIKTVRFFPNGTFPNKSLTSCQINEIKNLLNKKNIEIVDEKTESDWILGVENYETYYYASKGQKTTFINANFGKNIIKRLYENVEFLNI